MGKRAAFFPVAVLFFVVLSPGSLSSGSRRVLLELFSNTGCYPCANANRVLDDIAERYGEKLSIIRYHAPWPNPYDTFYVLNPEDNDARLNYYGVTFVPDLFVDGYINASYQTDGWEDSVLQALNKPSYIDLELQVSYDTAMRKGIIVASIEVETTINVSDPRLRTAITEDNIYYDASNGQKYHHQVLRELLPNAEGIPLNLGPPGSFLSETLDFEIDSSWEAWNCAVVAFVQDDGPKNILQSARKFIMPYPLLVFHHYRTDAPPYPGDTFSVHLTIENRGHGDATGIEVSLESSDPYLTPLGNSANVPDLAVGEIGTALSPLEVFVSSDCPDSHFSYLRLIMHTADGRTCEDSLPVFVTGNIGFGDDMESGDSWENYGLYGQWHLTENRFSSPTHSKYNGMENLWHYYNNSSIYSVSPWLLLGNDPQLEFEHWYEMEENHDFGYLLIDPGSGGIVIDSFTGSSGGWKHATYDLSDFAGSPVRIVFFFESDMLEFREGWYIDDVRINSLNAEEGSGGEEPGCTSMRVAPNPTRERANVFFNAPKVGRYTFGLFDVTGARRKSLCFSAGETGPKQFQFSLEELPQGVYYLIETSGNLAKKGVSLLKTR